MSDEIHSPVDPTPLRRRRRRGVVFVLWRYLICVAIATGVTLASITIFYMQPREIVIIFGVTFFVCLTLSMAWGSGGRVVRAAVSGVGGMGSAFSHFFILLAILAVAYWGSAEVFKRIDRDCRSHEWPHWYCF